MVGDYKGLLRGLNLYKIFAAYNMVLIHGVSIMHPVLIHFGYVENNHLRTSMLRGMFSMTLPLLAGFYLRHLVGPFFEEGKLTLSLRSQLPRLIFWIFTIEAIRLFSITGSVGWIFSWQVLHFIGLSSLVTYFALKTGRWGLAIAVCLSSLGHYLISSLCGPLVIQMTSVSEFQLQFAGWIFSFLGASLAALGVWIYGKKNIVLTLTIFFGFFLVLTFFVHPEKENLVSLLNLPLGMFIPVKGDRNFWPFLAFYPLFVSGYFFRSFFFDLKNARYFLPLTALVAFLGVTSFYFGIVNSGIDTGVANAMSFEVFQRGIPGTLVLISTAYFGWMFFYYLLRNNRFLWIDPWFRRSGNVLTIYVIHTVLFVLLRDVLLRNLDWVKENGSLLGIYFILHLIYGVSVFLSYTMVKLTHMYSQRKIRATSFSV